jgi:hypothetical protein
VPLLTAETVAKQLSESKLQTLAAQQATKREQQQAVKEKQPLVAEAREKKLQAATSTDRRARSNAVPLSPGLPNGTNKADQTHSRPVARFVREGVRWR